MNYIKKVYWQTGGIVKEKTFFLQTKKPKIVLMILKNGLKH